MTATPTKTDEVPDPVSVTTDGRKVSWGYARKVGLPNYSSEELSIFVSDLCPDDVDNVLLWANTMTPTVTAAVKALVWEGLGLTYSFDANGHPHLDQPAPPPAPPTPQPVQPGLPPQPRPANPNKPSDSGTMAQYGIHAEFPVFCKDCGEREFYDNRATQDDHILKGEAIGADWKCRNSNCGKKYYRPGSYPYNQAIKGGGAVPVATAPPEPQPQPAPPPAAPPQPPMRETPPVAEYPPDEEPF